MKSAMRLAFEKKYQFDVSDDMSISQACTWDIWRLAWNAATRHHNRLGAESEKFRKPVAVDNE